MNSNGVSRSVYGPKAGFLGVIGRDISARIRLDDRRDIRFRVPDFLCVYKIAPQTETIAKFLSLFEVRSSAMRSAFVQSSLACFFKHRSRLESAPESITRKCGTISIIIWRS